MGERQQRYHNNKNTTWPQSLHWAHRDSSQPSAKGNASTTKPLAVSSSTSNRVRTHMDTRTQWLSLKSMATMVCRQRKTWALFSKITTQKDFSNPSRTYWQKSCQDSTLVPFLSIHLACSITSAFAAS